MARVLVVEDDRTIAEVVSRYLRLAGHEVVVAFDGTTGLALATGSAKAPDIVVLDVMLPGLDGIEVCRRLREVSTVPLVMLTAMGTEHDRVLGLETGADDYVTKPFSVKELTLRVASLLRRSTTPPAAAPVRSLLSSGGLEVDIAARRVRRSGGGEVPMTVRETDLLVFLLRNPGRVFTREELLAEVWGWHFGDTSTVTVHARRLRRRVEEAPAEPRLLVTVWGVGYRWDAPVVERDLS